MEECKYILFSSDARFDKSKLLQQVLLEKKFSIWYFGLSRYANRWGDRLVSNFSYSDCVMNRMLPNLAKLEKL